jgi:hypothetical protein
VHGASTIGTPAIVPNTIQSSSTGPRGSAENYQPASRANSRSQ